MLSNQVFHYPPELFNLLIETIPLLNKSKEDVFLFFEGAGIPVSIFSEIKDKWLINKESIKKHTITRNILTKLNATNNNTFLGYRRALLKRVVDFDSFATCWPNDQMKARGCVAEIQNIINRKDSFVRMATYAENLQKEKSLENQKKVEQQLRFDATLENIKKDFFALFSEKNPHKRGLKIEAILNSLFSCYDILIRESFCICTEEDNGIGEQIDGVIHFDSHVYFVEFKWWQDPIGKKEISHHLLRIYQRNEVRALIISASNFTAPAILACKKALQDKVVVLCTLQELVMLLERKGNLNKFLQDKIQFALIEQEPFLEILE